MQYPPVRRCPQTTDILHGITINDPYRWLESPDSTETKAFVTAQNECFNNHISQYPHKESLHKQLTKMLNYEKFSPPSKRGSYYYHFHNSGLQPQSVLYKQTDLKSKPSVFFDPNTLSTDGTIALSTSSFSKSGKYFAYGLSASGSDWSTIHVRDAEDETRVIEETPVEWAKFTGIQWTHDDLGYFYTRYPEPSHSADKGTETDTNLDAMVCYHKIGTPQSSDKIVFQDKINREFTLSAEVSDDGIYIIISIHRSCDPVNKIYIGKVEDLAKDTIEFMKLVDHFDAEFGYVSNEGTQFIFQTTLNAPKRKIVKIDISSGARSAIDIIPESKDVLEFSHVVDNNKLVLVYLQDVKHIIKTVDLLSGIPLQHRLELPVGSIVQSITGRKEDNLLFYSYASFTSPGLVYMYDFSSSSGSVFRTVHVPGYNSVEFNVKQEFYESKDGTRIPMYIISKKDIVMNGTNPTLLYGYGGFNVSITPYFSTTWLTFVKNYNGIVCIANIRGGGEYGIAWNEAGKLHKKQNVFDDFIYAARYLHSQNYTCPEKLCINGGSNGGLLVAACMNQAPELFGCGVADVGVMDMLRFSLFTIGHAWCSDYGNPRANKDDLENVLKYSPVHNVQYVKPYPSYLLCTGDHDDRVVPLHSYKLIAQLQHVAKMNPNPLVIRIDTKSGHGAGKSTQQRISEAADKYSFIAMALNAKWIDHKIK